MAANFEPPKPNNRVTNLDNPSEIINQAQQELVFNNSSNIEDRPKGIEQKAKGRQYLLQLVFFFCYHTIFVPVHTCSFLSNNFPSSINIPFDDLS